jgi:hypothetical protein
VLPATPISNKNASESNEPYEAGFAGFKADELWIPNERPPILILIVLRFSPYSCPRPYREYGEFIPV